MAHVAVRAALDHRLVRARLHVAGEELAEDAEAEPLLYGSGRISVVGCRSLRLLSATDNGQPITSLV
jgi:hypothetical protein